jgi:FKBP-type peptidyl-prolyl cis-trans isomerase (trigger factor)
MNNIEISKNLASYAVYKELYDSKKDSYDIIAEFIKSTLKKRNKYSNITSKQVVIFLKEDFDFDIPESIIKTTLKHRLQSKKTEGSFSIENIESNLIFEHKQEEIIKNNEHIISNLYSYIEKQHNPK